MQEFTRYYMHTCRFSVTLLKTMMWKNVLVVLIGTAAFVKAALVQVTVRQSHQTGGGAAAALLDFSCDRGSLMARLREELIKAGDKTLDIHKRKGGKFLGQVTPQPQKLKDMQYRLYAVQEGQAFGSGSMWLMWLDDNKLVCTYRDSKHRFETNALDHFTFQKARVVLELLPEPETTWIYSYKGQDYRFPGDLEAGIDVCELTCFYGTSTYNLRPGHYPGIKGELGRNYAADVIGNHAGRYPQIVFEYNEDPIAMDPNSGNPVQTGFKAGFPKLRLSKDEECEIFAVANQDYVKWFVPRQVASAVDPLQKQLHLVLGNMALQARELDALKNELRTIKQRNVCDIKGHDARDAVLKTEIAKEMDEQKVYVNRQIAEARTRASSMFSSSFETQARETALKTQLEKEIDEQKLSVRCQKISKGNGEQSEAESQTAAKTSMVLMNQLAKEFDEQKTAVTGKFRKTSLRINALTSGVKSQRIHVEKQGAEVKKSVKQILESFTSEAHFTRACGSGQKKSSWFHEIRAQEVAFRHKVMQNMQNLATASDAPAKPLASPPLTNNQESRTMLSMEFVVLVFFVLFVALFSALQTRALSRKVKETGLASRKEIDDVCDALDAAWETKHKLVSMSGLTTAAACLNEYFPTATATEQQQESDEGNLPPLPVSDSAAARVVVERISCQL